ncbi:DUF1700 domain-containing protein [Paenibacillus sp. SYP-B3998]|uniref:DUF1700 domain-containing protein n=1 Tax=Paenibacillus sp. SYP-B3998 TaxID=2678564 RepID=A0A6G4A359_9BACL|nr:DUF1700 domain-containing protein [Paenibacillus sp. SYP-B3998]NEW08822.1 DUF1700 domain-containing protein [Paenibacillus sp. SYP-B3998]
MSKSDYFKELTYRLRGLPEKERHNILSVYEELFQKALANGKNEEDVAESLGYPRIPNWDAPKEAPREQQEPVKQASPNEQEVPFHRPESTPLTYEAERPVPSTQAYNTNAYANGNPYPPYPRKPESGMKAIVASIALGLFNLIFVLGLWFSLLGTLVALFVSGICLIIAPVVGATGSFLESSGGDLRLIFFAMLACFGLGLILTTIGSWLFKWFFKLTWMYIQFNAKLIKGA